MAQINTWPGWEPVRKLGDGTYGSVYEIRREEYGVTYRAALKVISVPVNESDVDQKRSMGMDDASVTSYFNSCVEKMAQEVALMASMKGNSNIVSYEDHRVVKRQDAFGWDILIRMELLTPLKTYVDNHPMDEAEVIRLGLHMCRALELCHRKSILHRDIKPENMFVNDNGDFKLGDFGISRTIEQSQGNYTNKAGTFYYMAPEVFNGREYGPTADLYSLGVVLYQYLNEKRLPFMPQGTVTMNDMDGALTSRLQGDPVPAPVHGSDALKQVVLKCIAYRPEDRYQSAGELSAALLECRSQVNQAPIPETQPERVPSEPESIRDEPDSQADFYAATALLFESEQPPQKEVPEESPREVPPRTAPRPQRSEPVVIQAGELDLSPCEAKWGGPKRVELSDGTVVSFAIPAGVEDQAVVSCEAEHCRYEWRVRVHPQAEDTAPAPETVPKAEPVSKPEPATAPNESAEPAAQDIDYSPVEIAKKNRDGSSIVSPIFLNVTLNEIQKGSVRYKGQEIPLPDDAFHGVIFRFEQRYYRLDVVSTAGRIIEKIASLLFLIVFLGLLVLGVVSGGIMFIPLIVLGGMLCMYIPMRILMFILVIIAESCNKNPREKSAQCYGISTVAGPETGYLSKTL